MKNTDAAALTAKVLAACERYGFYKAEEKTLVGFSGGADSVCLLHVLCRMLGTERIRAVHVNHMLRGADADADEAFCRKFCAERGIPLIIRRADVRTLSGGTGIENAARDIRYHIFSEEAEKLGCATVSLAHTASDNLETMIFYLCRGTGLSGLSGIPPMRMLDGRSVVRPLIACTREEILHCLEENGLPFRTDASNLDTDYTRNFIRCVIVPQLKKVNPAAEENAAAAAAAAAEAAAFIRKEASRFLSAYAQENAAPLRELSLLSPAVFYEAAEILYQSAGGKVLSRAQAEAVRGLVLDRKKGKRITLSGGILAAADGDRLVFTASGEQEAPAFSIRLREGKNMLPHGGLLYIGRAPSDAERAGARFSAHVRLPAQALDALYAKSRRPGMRYRTGGMTRSLKKLLCGAPSDTKRYRPVICRDDRILWFPGLGPADGLEDGEKADLYYLEI